MKDAGHALRGADLLAQALKARGVSRVFALSGNQIMPVFDALLSAGIPVTHLRHENACVYAAEAYAQFSGQVGVALVTAGAGLGNAVGALISARASDTAVLLLSGDSPLALDGRGAFQELDQCGLTRPVTKRSERVATAAGMGLEICAALDLAEAGRPGPVHLALPADLLEETVDSAPHLPERTDSTADWSAEIAQLLARLDAAQNPLILLGPSLNETRAPGLAKDLATLPRVTARVMESPRGLRDPGQLDLAEVLGAADHVLALGKQVDFTTGFGKGDAVWDVVLGDAAGLAGAERNLGPRLGIALEAPPQDVAIALHAAAQSARPVRTSAEAAPLPPGTITSRDLAQAVAAARQPGQPLLIDGGEIGQWISWANTAAPRMVNGPSGAIGGILPGAIGAAHARPGQRILAVMGDGTLGFHLGELETIARENLPITILIGNDRRWNAEHRIQVESFGADRAYACDLSPADYAATARALGLGGEQVTDRSALPAALARAFDVQGPQLLDILIDGLPAPTAHA